MTCGRGRADGIALCDSRAMCSRDTVHALALVLAACGSSSPAPITPVPATPVPPAVGIDLPETPPTAPACLGILANRQGALVYTSISDRFGPTYTQTLGFAMVGGAKPPIDILAFETVDSDRVEEAWGAARPELVAQVKKARLVPCIEVPGADEVFAFEGTEIRASWKELPSQHPDPNAPPGGGSEGTITVTTGGATREIGKMERTAGDGGSHELLEAVYRNADGSLLVLLIANGDTGLHSQRAVAAAVPHSR